MGKGRYSLLIGCMLLLAAGIVKAQTDISKLPVTVKVPANVSAEHPIVFFITGDGGMKKFSADMVNIFAGRGYPVIGLNTLKYFWNKKSPQQAAADVSALLQYYSSQWNNHAFILVGYSMGADVLPFIYQHLSAVFQSQTQHLVFMSPSASTDMVVHISDMLGKTSTPGSMSVPGAMNSITGKPLLLVFGQDEKDFDLKSLTISNYHQIVLPGGHHYNEDAQSVVQQILTHLYSKTTQGH
ncbi:virulence protein (VirJ) [Chitinophaga sp. CF118]|uniref:AcvB/VirJ family lysyl-phosphatidylglycerol hydrolase n=1 Tax=Chitinophaga sp. CF118 TaxID=1884367 RepID=UPI0008EB7DB7|nr:AcvB/VirJ family lysyl-phosphatidylglycerol hydrolase [Chitinophaga sp. CF118]SFE78191.1 virulence protein (VirJ) [Chitinophaga sp. CF118]